MKTIKEDWVKMFKRYNGMVTNIEEAEKHLANMQKCSDCKRDFYNKPCPECVEKRFEKLSKLKKFSEAEIRKAIDKHQDILVNKLKADFETNGTVEDNIAFILSDYFISLKKELGLD